MGAPPAANCASPLALFHVCHLLVLTEIWLRVPAGGTSALLLVRASAMATGVGGAGPPPVRVRGGSGRVKIVRYSWYTRG